MSGISKLKYNLSPCSTFLGCILTRTTCSGIPRSRSLISYQFSLRNYTIIVWKCIICECRISKVKGKHSFVIVKLPDVQYRMTKFNFFHSKWPFTPFFMLNNYCFVMYLFTGLVKNKQFIVSTIKITSNLFILVL